MANQVILEFIGDASGLKPASDALESLGALTKQQVETFKKANQDFAQRQVQNSERLKGAIDEAAARLKKIPEAIAGAAMNEANKKFEDLGMKLLRSSEMSKRLTDRLGELKGRLAQLEEGSPQFERLAEEAGQLEVKIGEVNDSIRNLAGDSRALDGLISIGESIMAGFSSAQGAAAAFGEETERLKPVMAQVLSVTGVLNELQGAQSIAGKEKLSGTLLELEGDYQRRRKDLASETEDQINEQALEKRKLALEAAAEGLRQLSEAAFEIAAGSRERELEEELAALEQRREMALANEDLTESQRSMIILR